MQELAQNYQIAYCDEGEMLRGALAYENALRERAEQELSQLRQEIEILKTTETVQKRTKEEIRQENLAKVERLRTGVKKDGKEFEKFITQHMVL